MILTEKDVKANILSVIGEGDILLIIPPFGSIHDVALGPHILHALARENGCTIDILYLNMLLASVIGIEHYDDIYFSPEFRMLGERLFARSAYGLPPLGKHPGWNAREAMSPPGEPAKAKILFDPSPSFNPEMYLPTEQLCCAFIEEVIPVISGLDYKIIGCTASMLRQTNCSIALLSGIKKKAPGIITIIGGDNCKGEMAEGIATLSNAIDYIFSGESETTFLRFLKDYRSGMLPPRGTIIPGEPLSNLDTLPLADYDIFLRQHARFLGESTAENIKIWYETSRGCWWGEKSPCTFCSQDSEFFRQKSTAKVLHDLEKIKLPSPGSMLFMTDISMPRSYINELLPVTGSKEGFPALGYQVRASLDLKDLAALKKAKVEAVLPGIETFASPSLKLMNKGITGSQALLFLRNAASVGLYTDWLLLWGIPGDQAADYEELLRLLPLLRHLQAPRKFTSIVIMRFSPYFNNPQRYHISAVKPWAVLANIYPAHASLEKLATYFSGEFPSAAYEHPDTIREIAHQVEIWKQKWKTTTLTMGRFMDAFAIYDTRDIHEKAKTHVLEYEQAQRIMTAQAYDESEILKWAVSEKLGVVSDSVYVPLVTASTELLLSFADAPQG